MDRAAGSRGKGLARRALAQELRRKGVDDEVAREALDEIDPADEEEAARRLVRKKLRSLSRVDEPTATRRLVGMLARKGYRRGWPSPSSGTSWPAGEAPARLSCHGRASSSPSAATRDRCGARVSLVGSPARAWRRVHGDPAPVDLSGEVRRSSSIPTSGSRCGR